MPDELPPVFLATFSARLFAIVLDFVVVTVVASVIATAFGGESAGLGVLLFVVTWLVYFAAMESSEQQATLGKSAVALKVVTTYGDRLSFGRALGRSAAKGLSTVLLGTGFLVAAFHPKRQSLHDLMAATLVVRR